MADTPNPPDPKSVEARPSDAEVAHHPEEGGAVRDPRLHAGEPADVGTDRNRGRLDGHPSKDLSGDAKVGERLGDRGHRLGS